MEFKFQEWMHNYASDQLRLVFEASGFYWTLGWFLASKQAPSLFEDNGHLRLLVNPRMNLLASFSSSSASSCGCGCGCASTALASKP